MELYDRVSAPAEKMSKAAERFEKSMHKAGASTEKMAKAQKELSAERIAVMTEAVKLGVEAFEHITEKVIEFGREILNVADAERSNELIFKSLAGSAEGGAKLFESAQEYAKKAGISNKEAVDIFRTLAKGNVKDLGENFFILAQAAGDLGARTGQSAASIADAFGKIITKNQLASHELRGLAELGVPVAILAKHLGVTATNAEELGTALNGRKISGGQAVQALISSLAELEGGKIGQLRKDLGGGFEGASNRVSNAWEKALASFGKTQAFTDIIGLMNKMADRMEDPRFISAVSDFASSMASAAKALASMAPSVETIHNVFGGGLGEKLAGRIEKAQVEGPDPKTLEGWFSSTKLGKWWGTVGEENAQKHIEGFAGPGGIDAHSPSKVFERLGGYSADGFSAGYQSKKDDALGIPSRSATQAPATGTSSGTGHRLELHQQFTIHAGTGMDVDALARKVVELSATNLQGPLENLAISVGTM